MTHPFFLLTFRLSIITRAFFSTYGLSSITRNFSHLSFIIHPWHSVSFISLSLSLISCPSFPTPVMHHWSSFLDLSTRLFLILNKLWLFNPYFHFSLSSETFGLLMVHFLFNLYILSPKHCYIIFPPISLIIYIGISHRNTYIFYLIFSHLLHSKNIVLLANILTEYERVSFLLSSSLCTIFFPIEPRRWSSVEGVTRVWLSVWMVLGGLPLALRVVFSAKP